MEGLIHHKFRRTTLISVGLAAFLLGLVAARHVVVPGFSWLFLLLPCVVIVRRKTLVALMAVCLIGLSLGVARGSTVMVAVSEYQQFYNQEIAAQGVVIDDPVYDDNGQFDFRVGRVRIDDTKLPGQVRVRGFVTDIRRGDAVRVAGRLQDGFGNYQAEVRFADIAVVSRSGSWLEKTRREFFASTYNVLPEPQASLGLGFLVGLRSALPEDFDEQLRIAGLTHIVVASGYNLTILVRLSRRLLVKHSKYQAFMGSVLLVLGFLVITGASPSITRAAVVTLLSLGAWYYGRRIHPILLILLGAALTAGVNPLFIWHDLGWWLSFLAFTGVLVLAPLLTKRLCGDKQPKLLAQVAIETIAAQVMATPLIMFVFGEFSLVALLANLAVVPFIPLAMLFTFVGGSVGFVSPVLGSWLALPAQWVLGYIVSITRLLASPSWAQQSVALGAGGLAVLYGVVAMVAVVLYRKTKLRFHHVPAVVE